LLSKRKKNFINVISIISILGVSFCTFALVVILSVFNGLEDLLRSLNNSFDPELKIVAAKGKSFVINDSLIARINSVPGVKITTEVIEDYAYVRYRDANQVVTIKGVSENFIDQKRIPRECIVEGTLRFKKDSVNYAVIGRGIQNTLSVAVTNPMFPLQLYYINNVKSGSLDPSKLYTRKNIIPGGVFSIVQNFDENYILVPLDFAKELLNYDNKRTSLEIKTAESFDVLNVQHDLKATLGGSFSVLNHEEQYKDLYRLLKMEKLFTFLAFTLLLGIGSINIFFSLMMLALDKKKDISILSAMGADQKLIRNIFLTEGALIASIGAIIGLILGGFFCWLQMTYGLISMGMQTSVIEGYPIKPEWRDFLTVLVVVSVITFLISYRPAFQASRFASVKNL